MSTGILTSPQLSDCVFSEIPLRSRVCILKRRASVECTNYQRISFLSLPGKVYANCLKRKCRKTVELKLEDDQCGFWPGHSTTDQIFTLRQIFQKSWEYAKDVFVCFADLEKAYDRVTRSKLWKVL